MPTLLTPGRLLFEQIVPESFREGFGADVPVDSKVVKDILQRVAEKEPDRYREISHQILKLGARASTETSSSFSLDDLRSPIDKRSVIAQVEIQEAAINANPKLTEDQKENERIKLYAKLSSEFPGKVYDAAFAKGSNLARMVASGARGNKGQLNSNIGADWLMIDSNGKPVPVPIKNSYAEGLSPAEYFASSYGTRRGLISTKFAVQDSGYLAKQLAAAAHDLVISTKDCETGRGIPTDANDKDNIGAVLARPIGNYGAGTVITSRVLKDLRQQDVGNFLVRSPVTCQAHGGLCSMCAGIRERNHLPKMMDNLGLAAASSLSEPLSQGLLCLEEGTLVRMADWSVRKIEEVRIGEWVLGADKTGRTLPVRVTNVFNNGQRECFSTLFSRGRKRTLELRSTLDHKILCKWLKTNCTGAQLNNVPQVLPVGTRCRDFSAILPNEFDDSQAGFVYEPAALFLGLVLGDGCCTESVDGVHLSCHDNLLIEDTAIYLRTLNLKLTHLKGHVGYFRFSQVEQVAAQQDEDGRFCGSFRNPAQIAVRRFGIHGKYAHEKTIPEECFGWNNRAVAELLAGLFATDGSVYLRRQRGETWMGISFTSVSRDMVLQVKDLLEWRFGIHSTFHKTDPSNNKSRGAFDIKIATSHSLKKFIQHVPVPGVKARKLREWAKFTETKLCCRNARSPRVKQVPIGTRNTWDIEVDHPDHLFVLANGLIVSNSEKHSGGVASSSGRAATGFKAIDSLVQVPDVFPGGATIAQLDGRVGKIEAAPQGGSFIHINDQKHYVPGDAEVTVKSGDEIEAGDTLSSGVPNPADIVRHKGIGQGRMYFVQAMQKAFKDNGLSVDRRNLEVLSRALVNHVRVSDPEGFNGALPDDVVEYNSLERDYVPESSRLMKPKAAIGSFLQKPSLYFSVGTRITPKVAKTMEDNGENEIEIGDTAPGFEPEMQRVMEIPAFKPDWLAQFHGSYLKKRLQQNVESGDAVSNIHGTSYVPGLAKGTEFGRPPKGVIGY